MTQFKENDVIIYGEGYWDPPSHGIVLWDNKGDLRIKAFRHFCSQWNGEWHEGLPRGAIINNRNARLHPDPDKVWADYCAWRLTQ